MTLAGERERAALRSKVLRRLGGRTRPMRGSAATFRTHQPLAPRCFTNSKDGHRLAAILGGTGGLKLISCKGNDRTLLFRAPFDGLLSAGWQLVLDGEIAVFLERRALPRRWPLV